MLFIHRVYPIEVKRTHPAYVKTEKIYKFFEKCTINNEVTFLVLIQILVLITDCIYKTMVI